MLGAISKFLRPLVTWEVIRVFQTDLRKGFLEVPYKERFEVKVFASDEDFEAAKAAVSSTGVMLPEKIEARLRNGEVVAVGYADSQAIGYCWMSLGQKWEPDFKMNWVLESNEAVIYNAFVLTAWRGQGVHVCLNIALKQFARERGFVRTLGWINWQNRQSLNITKHMGQERIMTLLFVRVRGFKRPWKTAFGAPLNSRFQE